MSFARRMLIVVLVIQALVIVREIVFVIGLEQYLSTLGRGDPIAVLATLVLCGNVAVLVPVARGNRWATLASLPLLVLLLLAALPLLMPMFGSPSEGNFAVWLTFTVVVVATIALGIPFGMLATLEAFGRVRPAATIPSSGFSAASVFVSSIVAAVLGMTLLAVAVAATPGKADSTFDRSPDGYASIAMRDLGFVPADLELVAGQTMAVFVTNEDGFDHSFDIDSLDLHVRVGTGETRVVMLSPETSGALDVYCSVPGHRESGMVTRFAVQ